ncbi:MAG: type II toxin-antitoxin system VapC family toxin [Candidatus Riflebacteria bacterium]|nr:type II toxin-antitoxin system VapC family toxin [Candidatus Riflebacteria bacterium]
MIVADTNLIAYLLIPGEHTSVAKAVLKKDPAWHAPTLWRTECVSVLLKHLKRGDFGPDVALDLIDSALELMKTGEHHVRQADVLRLAQKSGRSAYDCDFVALAQDLNLTLVTADERLAGAFPDCIRTMDEFLK